MCSPYLGLLTVIVTHLSTQSSEPPNRAIRAVLDEQVAAWNAGNLEA